MPTPQNEADPAPSTTRVVVARAGALVIVVALAVGLFGTRNELRAVRDSRAQLAERLDGQGADVAALVDLVERQSALIRSTGTAATRAQAAELDDLAARLLPAGVRDTPGQPAPSTPAAPAPIVVTVRPGPTGPPGPPGDTPDPVVVTVSPAPAAQAEPCMLDVLSICLRRPQ